jgi:hypothetical protein
MEKSIRIPPHTIQNLYDRDIDRAEIERTLDNPEFVVPSFEGRQVYMRRYHDAVLGQDMLLRVVVEEIENELVVVTVYKTSRIERYLKGLRK